jgi:hypothetical protein
VLVLALTCCQRASAPSTQGAFALFTSVESLVIALASGPGLLLARQVSQRGQASPTALGAVVGASLLTGGAAGLAVAALAAWGPEAYGPLALLAWALPLVLLTPNLACLWLGAGRMLPMARLSLAPPLLALAAVLACSLLWPALSLGHLLGSWVAAKAGVAAGLLGWLWWRGRVALPSRAPRRAEWSFVAMLGLTNLVGMLNYRVGLFVVERQMGLDATGLYSIAVIAAELLWFVSGSLTQAAYSRIGSADPQAAAATAVRVAQLSLVALLLAAPAAVRSLRAAGAAIAGGGVCRQPAAAGTAAARRRAVRRRLGAVGLLHQPRRCTAGAGGCGRVVAGGQWRGGLAAGARAGPARRGARCQRGLCADHGAAGAPVRPPHGAAAAPGAAARPPVLA